MKRLLIGIVLLLIGLPFLFLAVLILAQVELNLTSHRETINRWASKATEKKVMLEGDLRLTFGLQPSLSLSQLRVADGLDDSRVLAKIDQLFAKTNLGVLTGRHLEMLELELAGSELNLRVDAAGKQNWGLGEQADDSEVFELDKTYLPQQARIAISDSKLRYEDLQQGTSWALDLTKAHAELRDADTPVELLVEGVWNELPLKITGKVNPSMEAKNAPDAPLSLTLSAQILGIDAKAEGHIINLGHTTQRTDLTIDSSTNELMRLREVFGSAVPMVKQAALHFQIKDQNGILEVSDIKTRLDETKISGALSLNRASQRPALQGKLELSDLDTRHWMKTHTSAKKTSATKQVSLLEQLEQLPPPLPLDIQLVVIGRNIQLPSGLKQSFSFDFNGDAHNLEVALLELDPVKIPLKGSLHKQHHDREDPTYLLKLSDPDVQLATWAEIFGLAGQVEGEMQLNIDLRSQGISDEQIRQALEGHVRLLMGAGKANVSALDNLVGGLTAAVGNLFTEKSELAVVNCSAIDIGFADGQAKVNLGLIDTTYSTVLVDGNADIVNRTLDLTMTPRKKALSLSVAPKVMIKGPTKTPEYIIEKGSLVLSLGQFLANVVYPPTLLLNVFDEAARGNPCVAMLSGEAVPDSTDNTAEPAGTTSVKPTDTIKPQERIHGADILDH